MGSHEELITEMVKAYTSRANPRPFDMRQAMRDVLAIVQNRMIEPIEAELAALRAERDALRAAIDDAEHAEDCQCLIRAKGGTKYDAAWCDCWLAKIYAIDATRKETP